MRAVEHAGRQLRRACGGAVEAGDAAEPVVERHRRIGRADHSATNRPHAAATAASRPMRGVRGLRCVASQSPLRARLDRHALDRPHQHRRSLDQGHHEEQHHERHQDHRDRDRALAAAALLLLGEHDPVRLVACCPSQRSCSSRRCAARAAPAHRSAASRTARTDRRSRRRTGFARAASARRRPSRCAIRPARANYEHRGAGDAAATMP